MEHLTLSAGNSCALLVYGDRVQYLNPAPGALIFPGDGHTGFEEFASPDDALKRAKELQPTFRDWVIKGYKVWEEGHVYPAGAYVYHNDQMYRKLDDDDQSPPDAVAGGWSEVR
jgi:hypothetical protein